MFFQNSLSKGDFLLANQRKATIQKAFSLAGNKIDSNIFQNLFGIIKFFYGNTVFFFQNLPQDLVFI